MIIFEVSIGISCLGTGLGELVQSQQCPGSLLKRTEEAGKQMRQCVPPAWWKGDSEVTLVRRTLASSPPFQCATCRQQGHAGSKISF